jgi:type I restriction enzyme M protein
LTEADIAKVADTYHAWRETGGRYADVPGFAKSAATEDIAVEGYVLTPGRYVGAVATVDEDEPFEERMIRLSGD